jgi:hypothetical protein
MNKYKILDFEKNSWIIHTFIQTPLTLGQLCLLALYLKYALPAFNIGLSIRPPPATIPIMARFVDFIVFLAPDGNLTFVLLASGLCEIIVAEFPEAKKNLVNKIIKKIFLNQFELF